MKKITSIISIAALLLFTGCQNGAPTGTETAQVPASTATETAKTPAAPFNMDYDTEQNLDFFTKPESLEFLASGGPYYISPNTLPMPAFEEFNKLKQAKIDETMKITDELIANANSLEGKIRQYESSLFAVLGVAAGEDRNSGELTTENVNERAFYVSKELITSSYIKSLPASSEDPYITAGANYHKSMLALEMGQIVLDDYTSLLLNAGHVYDLLQSSSNETVKTALSGFDKEMEAAGDAKTQIEGIIAKSAELDAALRQLATADYYMAQTSVEYLKMEIPKAKTALESIKASEDFSEEDIALAKQYVAIYEELVKDLENRLANLKDKDQLLLAKTTGSVPAAHADFYSAYESTKSVLSSGVSAVGSGIATTVDYGWAATKATVHGAQIVAGSVVEGAGTITKSTFDFYSGLYYGNSLADIKARQNENYANWWDKSKNGTAGSETLKLGGEILDKSEDIVSGIITAPIKYTWGEGYVTWAVGGVAKMGAGVFTSLGKGIFKLANPEATREDMFWGAFDLATSLLGGSSTVVKASQVTEGGAKAAKNFLDQGATYLAKILGKSKAAKLADRLEEINTLLKQSGLDKEVKAALKKELKQTKNEINRLKNVANALEESSQTLKKEISDGVNNFKQNSKDLVKKNLNDQAENVSKTFKEDIESSVSGYVKKFLDPIKSPSDIFDNYIHGELDKFLAGEGKDFIAKTLIPWLMGNYDGVYAGDWKTQVGSFPVAVTVADSKITGQGTISFSANGVSVKSNISINGTVDGKGGISGTMSQTGQLGGMVAGSGGGGGTIGGDITNGTMTMTYSGSGSTTMTVQGYSTTAGGSSSGSIILTRQL
jgi:hypothetical protein